MNKKLLIVIGAVIVGVILVIVGIVLGCVVFPNLVDSQIKENVELEPKTSQYERFEELPIPLSFKVYLFNIKNRDDANNGAQLEVEEVGPYIYRETRKKANITDANNGTISYYEYQHYEFDQKASGKLSESDKVTILNPALNSVIQIGEKVDVKQVSQINVAVTNACFGSPDIYLDVSVHDLIFGGYKFCDKANMEGLNFKNKIVATILCDTVRKMPTKNIVQADNYLLFSLFDYKNTTNDGLYTINNGKDDIEKVGLIEKWNSSEYLNVWNGGNSTCNKVRGTDAVIFPPHLTEDTKLTAFNTDICRTMDLLYSHDLTYRDLSAYQYSFTKDTLSPPSADLDTECYCVNQTHGIESDNGCLKAGVLDLFNCVKAPMVLSFPHFLWAHADYAKSVKGLLADEEKHKTYVNIEPTTGSPLAGSKRVQLNMFLRNVANITYLQNYTTPRIVPIVWIDETVEINDDLYNTLYDSLVKKMMLVHGLTWGLIALGLFIIVVTLIVFWLKCRKQKETV